MNKGSPAEQDDQGEDGGSPKKPDRGCRTRCQSPYSEAAAGHSAPEDELPAPTLDDLLHAVATGDRVAFDHLYGQTVYPVMSLVRLLMRDVALAEEVTQEVFLTVWLRAARFDATRGRAAAWILAIARSRAIDRIRSSQAARDRDHRFASQPMTDPRSPAEAAVADFERHRIHFALATLTSVQRQALMLAFFGGHTYSETAGILGVPVPTLKSRVREGLIRLRHQLNEG